MAIKLQKLPGNLTIVFLSVFPVILWLLNVGFDAPFESLGTFIASLGKAGALSGLTLYCINPVLSMRHRWLEFYFGGLNNLYNLHKYIGKTSFVLILAHPFLLGLGRFINGKSVTIIWDWSGLLVITGIVALVFLIFTTAMSIYSHIKHQNWVNVHKLFGWLIVLFFAHALIGKSQITKIPELFVFMMTIGSIGMSAFLYRSVFSKWFVKRYKYQVSDVNKLTDSVVEIVLKPLGIPLSFQAGQFAYLSFDSEVVDAEPHPFSFSNANNGPYIRFVIKALGDDTTKFRNLQLGTKAYLEGPFGQFSYKHVKNKKQVWIAGGVGITPFLSMARSFSGKQNYDIKFFYGTESLADAVFLQEFIDITRHLPDNFNTSVVAKNYSGFVTIDSLKQSLGNLTDYDYLICGPPRMMDTLQKQLSEAGVNEQNVHVESFSM